MRETYKTVPKLGRSVRTAKHSDAQTHQGWVDQAWGSGDQYCESYTMPWQRKIVQMFMLVFLMLGLNIWRLHLWGGMVVQRRRKRRKIPINLSPRCDRRSAMVNGNPERGRTINGFASEPSHQWTWLDGDDDDEDDDEDDNDDNDDDIILFRDEKDQLCPPRAEPGDAWFLTLLIFHVLKKLSFS